MIGARVEVQLVLYLSKCLTLHIFFYNSRTETAVQSERIQRRVNCSNNKPGGRRSRLQIAAFPKTILPPLLILQTTPYSVVLTCKEKWNKNVLIL